MLGAGFKPVVRYLMCRRWVRPPLASANYLFHFNHFSVLGRWLCARSIHRAYPPNRELLVWTNNGWQRLARGLIHLSQRFGQAREDGSIRMMPIRHELLSRYVGHLT